MLPLVIFFFEVGWWVLWGGGGGGGKGLESVLCFFFVEKIGYAIKSNVVMLEWSSAQPS